MGAEFVNDDASVHIDTGAAIAQLQLAVEAQTARSVFMFRASSAKHYPINVSSTMLERVYDYCLINRHLEDSSLPTDFLQAVRRAQPSPSNSVADLRWGLVFCREDGPRILSVYWDEKGERGVINGACYTFGATSLRSWAESVCPQGVGGEAAGEAPQ